LKRITYDPKNDYYKIVGVAPHANADKIQQAYRQRAKVLHPDLNPDKREWATAHFQQLNEAYDVLSDPLLRRQYDEQRGTTTRRPPAENWWDVPHPRQPGYSGTRNQAPRRPAPSNTNQARGIAFLRPLFDLFFSPYRYLLGILTLVLIGNVAFILWGFATEPRQNVITPSATPFPTSMELASGSVAPPIITATPPLPETTRFALRPCQIDLGVSAISRLRDVIKITAAVSQEVKASNVRMAAVLLLPGEEAERLGEWQLAELNLYPVAQIEISGAPILAPDIPAGLYAVQWTAVLPDGSLLPTCHQVVTVLAAN